MLINDLTALIKPPGKRYPRVEWEVIEQELGCYLPADYRELVEFYGPGTFSGFIHIFQPNSELPAIDLKTQQSKCISALRQLRDMGEYIPYQIDGDPELLPIGITDNGDVLYWRMVDKTQPDDWPVVVNASRDDRWAEFPGPLSHFLALVLSHRIDVPMFPQSFTRHVARFESYDGAIGS